jgi:thiol-disulfide isomerase/thioredoxin
MEPMPNKRTRAIVVAATLAVAAGWTLGAGTEETRQRAYPAHNFTFEDINPASPTHGEQVQLSDLYRDSGLVLQFVASWCGPCRKELPDLQELHEEGQPILLVAADEYGHTEGILIVAERTGLTTPLLFVPEEEAKVLEEHYDHEILPATYFIAANGLVLGRHEGAMSKSRLSAAIKRIH